MIIPGAIIAAVTFPGVVVHEFGHRFFCELTKTRVREVCYFRFGTPSGYVVHDTPSSIWKHILIGIGPLFVNSGIGLLIALLLPFVGSASEGVQLLWGPLGWLAVSIAMHSFPSTGDAQSIWRALRAKGTPVSAVVVGTPIVGIIYLGALGSVAWLDLAYAYALVFVLPEHLSFV